MSDPKNWLRPADGRFTEVHTPFTTRAKVKIQIINLKNRN